MKNIFYLLSVCTLLLPHLAMSAIVDGLYEAEISVPNQSKSERSKAMSEGLGEVFIKVSGNPQVITIDAIRDAMGKAGSYLQQFLYRRPADVKNANPNQSRNQVLWLLFDEKSINKILRDNSQPVWGRTRPSTLVWLAVEQDGGRFLLGSGGREEFGALLRYEAKRQGLALVLPLMDLQDQRQLSFSDVWGGFQDPIEVASQRYPAEAILVGRMSLSRSDIWTARWSLYEGSEPITWESQGRFAEEIIRLSLAQVTGTLASRYAVILDDDSGGEMRLSIQGVNSLEQYARINDYLQSLQPVQAVLPQTISDGAARYRLKIRGNADGVVRIIALGNVLKEVPLATVNPNDPLAIQQPIEQDDSDFKYRLMQ